MPSPDKTSGGRASRGALIVAFAAIYLIWGSTYLGIRVAVETIPPFLMAGMRFVISGTLVFSFMILRGNPWPSLRQWRDQAIVGVLLLLGGNGVVSWAEQQVPSGITCLILGSAPLIVVGIDWLRPGGKRPATILLVGVMIGIGGLALLLGPGSFPAGLQPPAGAVTALLLSSVCWWLGSFYSKHAVKDPPKLLMASAMQMLAGCVSILLTSFILGEFPRLHIHAITPASWVAFGYLVVVGSIIAFPVYSFLLENSTPSKVSTFAYVNPVVAVILGWAILGEPLNLRIGIAAAIILGAVALITIRRSKMTR
ncbi:MAG TPA: EamA family transporter [Opitutaceae bacterium]|jgi:drug/metabolite transporter (DMT)-like permease|nr:EamA family transporter [Opitutaceae bacterium]